jgi:hypothetical protein
LVLENGRLKVQKYHNREIKSALKPLKKLKGKTSKNN